ncbi:MAG: hypothetical protein ACREKN_02270 [Longimicrobiaceae bacterium]
MPQAKPPARGTGRAVIFGKRCPRCKVRSQHIRTPSWLRPLRSLLFGRCSYRRCTLCGWKGLALHRPR